MVSEMCGGVCMSHAQQLLARKESRLYLSPKLGASQLGSAGVAAEAAVTASQAAAPSPSKSNSSPLTHASSAADDDAAAIAADGGGGGTKAAGTVTSCATTGSAATFSANNFSRTRSTSANGFVNRLKRRFTAPSPDSDTDKSAYASLIITSKLNAPRVNDDRNCIVPTNSLHFSSSSCFMRSSAVPTLCSATTPSQNIASHTLSVVSTCHIKLS
jgi:hypothetical protein